MEYLSDLQVCIRWKCEGGVLILVLMEYSLTKQKALLACNASVS